jgi:predicted Zn-dependent protease
MRQTALVAVLVAALAAPAAPAFAMDWGNVLKGAEAAGTELTKAASAFTISQAEEVAIGQSIHDEILQESPALDNASVQAYVKQVGDRLAAQAKTPYTYTFTVINSDEVNAFAAPGGFVFVTTGALRLMTTEAQLAGVLGHEVAHVAKRHGIEGIKKAMLAQSAVAGIAGANEGSGIRGELVKVATKFGMDLVLKGFDRAAESESDDFGAKYAAGAGYDPKGIEEFLTTLGQHAGEGPVWLMPVASHPRSDDRVKALAAKRPAAPSAPVVGAKDYQRRVLAVIGAAGKQ